MRMVITIFVALASILVLSSCVSRSNLSPLLKGASDEVDINGSVSWYSENLPMDTRVTYAIFLNGVPAIPTYQFEKSEGTWTEQDIELEDGLYYCYCSRDGYNATEVWENAPYFQVVNGVVGVYSSGDSIDFDCKVYDN